MNEYTPIPANRSLTIPKTQALVRRHYEDVAQEVALAETVKEIGLSKPKNWPEIMSWPPRTLRDAMKAGKLTEETLPKFQAYYDKYADKTVERARKLRAHLERDESRNEDLKRGLLFLKKKRFDYDGQAIHEHMGWAMLLDPHGDYSASYQKMVASWGRTTMTTLDGGKVRIHEDRLVVSKPSEAAIRIMVEEAAARGWDTLSGCGDKKFVAEMMKVANQHGIRVEMTVLKGPFGLFGRKVESNVPILKDKGMVQELGMLRQELAADLGAPTVKKPALKVEASQEPEIPMG